jgi:hypothetical protein
LILDESHEDAYLPSLHLSKVELLCKKNAPSDIWPQGPFTLAIFVAILGAIFSF